MKAGIPWSRRNQSNIVDGRLPVAFNIQGLLQNQAVRGVVAILARERSSNIEAGDSCKAQGNLPYKSAETDPRICEHQKYTAGSIVLYDDGWYSIELVSYNSHFMIMHRLHLRGSDGYCPFKKFSNKVSGDERVCCNKNII